MSSFFIVAHRHPVIVLRIAVGHSDGMRERGHQIGSPCCKNTVNSASFSLCFYFILIGTHLKMLPVCY